MREFTNIISDEFLRGLPPDKRVRRGAPYVSDCFNLKATVDGLAPFEPVIDPFASSVDMLFPFPQIFHGSRYTILANKDEIRIVDSSATPWTSSALSVVDIDNNPVSFDADEPWQFVDFGDVWYLFTSNFVIMLDGEDAQVGNTPTAYGFSHVPITTGVQHQGRILFGGFTAGQVWTGDWITFLNGLVSDLDMPFNIPFNDIDHTYVMWSSVGGGDFPAWLFFPERAFVGSSLFPTSTYSQDSFQQSMLYDRMRRNEFGFMRIPSDGAVKCIKTLGTRIVVYTETGIFGLFPHLSRDSEISTYGMVHLSRTGIKDKSFVGGDDRQHIFIDTEGSLWAVSGEFSINKLGYKEFLSPLLENHAAISKNVDTQRLEYYISGVHTVSGSPVKSNFVLTNSGLTRHAQQIASTTFIDGGTVGTCTDMEDEEAFVVSNQTDMGVRGIKTVTSVNVSFQGGVGVQVAIDYRYRTSDQFSRSHFVPLNNEGNAVIRVAGIDFRVVLYAIELWDFEVDYIQLKWQSSDKRHIRGTVVAPQVGTIPEEGE